LPEHFGKREDLFRTPRIGGAAIKLAAPPSHLKK
jgi:hypothetical protein